MLAPTPLRFALIELAEYGRVHMTYVEDALQVLGGWPGEARIACADGYWTVTALRRPPVPSAPADV